MVALGCIVAFTVSGTYAAIGREDLKTWFARVKEDRAKEEQEHDKAALQNSVADTMRWYEFAPETVRTVDMDKAGGYNLETGMFIAYTPQSPFKSAITDTQWQVRYGVDVIADVPANRLPSVFSGNTVPSPRGTVLPSPLVAEIAKQLSSIPPVNPIPPQAGFPRPLFYEIVMSNTVIKVPVLPMADDPLPDHIPAGIVPGTNVTSKTPAIEIPLTSSTCSVACKRKPLRPPCNMWPPPPHGADLQISHDPPGLRLCRRFGLRPAGLQSLRKSRSTNPGLPPLPSNSGDKSPAGIVARGNPRYLQPPPPVNGRVILLPCDDPNTISGASGFNLTTSIGAGPHVSAWVEALLAGSHAGRPGGNTGNQLWHPRPSGYVKRQATIENPLAFPEKNPAATNAGNRGERAAPRFLGPFQSPVSPSAISRADTRHARPPAA